MARRKAQRDPRSGAPGIAQKRSAGAPSLNPITRPHGYLDPHVRADEIRNGDNDWARFWDDPEKVAKWSQPTQPVRPIK